jgi:hypothetical protein
MMNSPPFGSTQRYLSFLHHIYFNLIIQYICICWYSYIINTLFSSIYTLDINCIGELTSYSPLGEHLQSPIIEIQWKFNLPFPSTPF